MCNKNTFFSLSPLNYTYRPKLGLVPLLHTIVDNNNEEPAYMPSFFPFFRLDHLARKIIIPMKCHHHWHALKTSHKSPSFIHPSILSDRRQSLRKNPTWLQIQLVENCLIKIRCSKRRWVTVKNWSEMPLFPSLNIAYRASHKTITLETAIKSMMIRRDFSGTWPTFTTPEKCLHF